MSYVLDALRRAEAERQRGAVPGLHAQTLPAPEAGPAEPGGSPGRWGLWLGGALVAAGLVAGGVWWAGGSGGGGTPPQPAEPLQADPAPPVVVVPRPVRPPVVARTPAARPPTGSDAPADAPADAAVAAKVVPYEQLPESLRRQMPPLTFGGATHSPEPSARMLIINGQIWREGDEPAPGLRLERIELRTAQFRFRDRRFEMAY
jgi:general secretion pathway protein B